MHRAAGRYYLGRCSATAAGREKWAASLGQDEMVAERVQAAAHIHKISHFLKDCSAINQQLCCDRITALMPVTARAAIRTPHQA